MTERALLVAFHCLPGRKADFIQRAMRHAETVRREPGCMRCDVLEPNDDGNVIYLYELFADEAELAAHAAMPYMPQFVADAKAMTEFRTRTECSLQRD